MRAVAEGLHLRLVVEEFELPVTVLLLRFWTTSWKGAVVVLLNDGCVRPIAVGLDDARPVSPRSATSPSLFGLALAHGVYDEIPHINI